MGLTIFPERILDDPDGIGGKLASRLQQQLIRPPFREVAVRTVHWSLLNLLFLLTLASCGSEGRNETPDTDDAGFRSHQLIAGLGCKASDGLLQCLRLNEPIAAERHLVELTRLDGQFCISSAGSKAMCLQDFDGIEHVFLERAKDQFVVVETDAAGGYTVLVLDSTTGRVGRVDNQPLFSPAAPFFATVSYDIDAGFLPNRVAIWDASSSELVYQVDRFASGTGPIAIRWSDPTRLEVIYSRAQYSPSEKEDTGTFNIWRNNDSTWSDDYPR